MSESVSPTFGPDGLVPAIVQDTVSRRVLMVAYMNQESLAATEASGEVHFWSRSRDELWRKGATSGNTLRLVSMRLDCDGDAILVEAVPTGPACHTGAVSCFDEDAESDVDVGFGWLEQLWRTIEGRRAAPVESSYTARLIAGGVAATSAKVIEEAAEVVEAAELHFSGVATDRRVAEEAADVLYHLLVLLAERSIDAGLVIDELLGRAPGTPQAP